MNEPLNDDALMGQLLASPPFSFAYDGVSSRLLLPTWPRTQTEHDLGDGRTQTTVVWIDPTSGLEVSWRALQYVGHSTISWILHFANTSGVQSATIADLLAVDLSTTGDTSPDWFIHTANGNLVQATDFAQVDVALAQDSRRTLTNLGGMSTQGAVSTDPAAVAVGGGWPYYNVDWGGGGLIVALGWPGQWAMEMKRIGDETLHVLGGMSQQDELGKSDDIFDARLTELWLSSGESIRTPLIAVQSWTAADWTDAQNVWRAWLIDYLLPRVGGELLTPICASQANDYFTDQDNSMDVELDWLAAYGAHNATAGTLGTHDHWWIDAGWYEVPPDWQDVVGTWPKWEAVGTWTPDSARFPKTSALKAVSDRARELGMSFLLWFEPERVMPNTWLYENRPEWLLSAPGYTSFWGPDGAYHLDFGNPDARQWAIEYFDAFLTEHGVDLYREDSNYPFLQYWVLRHPDLVIDNSAGGGHRLDLELIQRSVTLIQDDKLFDSTANQCQTFGIRYWIPWTGSAARIEGTADDIYNARSNMGLSFHVALDVRSASAADWDLLNRMAAEWRGIANQYYGEYYSLTPFTAADDAWMSWQFNRPDLGTGHLQCFARPSVPTWRPLTVFLRGLDPSSDYRAWDVDNAGSVSHFQGSQLMAGNPDSVGMHVAPTPRPYAVTVRYEKV